MVQYKNVLLPSKIDIVEEYDNIGVYEISNLYPGYGHTLGNSLRRMILSSISGAAITQIKIEGVQHEFSTIDGIIEDVLTIILNLKSLSIEVNGDEPLYSMKINKSGKGIVTAADIETPSQITIHNKDLHIAEITSSKVKLSIEMNVEVGIGFLSKEENMVGKVETGTIVPDAHFSPIVRAFYEVENMRVGNRTDFNKLRINIETNGSIKPKIALEKSIETMILQLKSMSEFKMDTVLKPDEQMSDEEVNMINVDTLPLTPSIISSLGSIDVKTIGDVLGKTSEEILAAKGLGEKGLKDLRNAISDYGVTIN